MSPQGFWGLFLNSLPIELPITCPFMPGFFCSMFRYWDLPMLLHVGLFACFMSVWWSLLWVYHTVFIHSAVDRCLDCFQFMAIINNGAVNKFLVMRFGEHVCTSVWYIHGLCVSQNSTMMPSDPCLCTIAPRIGCGWNLQTWWDIPPMMMWNYIAKRILRV